MNSIFTLNLIGSFLYGSTVIHYCDRPNPSYLKVICTGKDGMTTAKGFPHPFKYFLFIAKSYLLIRIFSVYCGSYRKGLLSSPSRPHHIFWRASPKPKNTTRRPQLKPTGKDGMTTAKGFPHLGKYFLLGFEKLRSQTVTFYIKG